MWEKISTKVRSVTIYDIKIFRFEMYNVPANFKKYRIKVKLPIEYKNNLNYTYYIDLQVNVLFCSLKIMQGW